ncbi:hypothetical protein [Mycobacterium sp.]|uniref:hypothetical protein n=1 Tax=Mycobacterium sp. TaxID=1785 RepID=UPI002580E83D|nr:hypothetical protein [Mycobacterium sp.]
MTTLHCWALPVSLTRVTAETAGEVTMSAGVVGSLIGSRSDQQSCSTCWWEAVAVSQRVTQSWA